MQNRQNKPSGDCPRCTISIIQEWQKGKNLGDSGFDNESDQTRSSYEEEILGCGEIQSNFSVILINTLRALSEIRLDYKTNYPPVKVTGETFTKKGFP